MHRNKLLISSDQKSRKPKTYGSLENCNRPTSTSEKITLTELKMGKDFDTTYGSQVTLGDTVFTNEVEPDPAKENGDEPVKYIEEPKIEIVVDMHPPKQEPSCCSELTNTCCGENIEGLQRCCCCLVGSVSELWDCCHQIGSCRHRVGALCTVEHLKNTFPIMKWLPKYRLPDFLGDLIAGITAALTVLPQSLAFAKIAALPPEYGLYSAFIGCFVYMVLGTAKDVQLGPAAVMSLLTARFGGSPIPGDPTYAIVLALGCGVVQFLLGVFSLGFIVDFISLPVINAFTSASVITIFFGQIPNWLGLKGIPRDFMKQVYWVFKRLPETNIGDFLLGLVSMILLFLMKKMQKINCCCGGNAKDDKNRSRALRTIRYIIWLLSTARNAVLVISAAGAMAIYSHYEVQTFNFTLTGKVPAGLPPFQPPAFSVSDGNTTYTASDIFQTIGVGFFIVPVLGLVQAIAVGKTFARINKYEVDPNQELLANGVAHILGAFVGAYPIAASISRSSVYSQSGAKTSFGGFYTGAIVMVALLCLTPFFYYIPTATLAAIIIMAVLDMGNSAQIVEIWNIKKVDFIPWLVTFVLSFIIGVEYGLLVGMGVSVLFLLYPTARPRIKTVKEPGVCLKPKQGMMFPSSEYLRQVIMDTAQLDRVANHRLVVMDFNHVSNVDYTVVQGIKQCIDDYWARKIEIVFCNLRPGVLETLQRMKLTHFKYTETVEEAFESFKADETTQSGDLISSTDGSMHEMEIDNHTDHTDETTLTNTMPRHFPEEVSNGIPSKSHGIDNASYNF